jgi:MYXO-CTERM domain-containing protein
MKHGFGGWGRIALAAVAVCSLWSSQSAAVPAAAFQAGGTIPGFVAYWPLDTASAGTVADATGNGHTGTLTNGASIIAPPVVVPPAPAANAGCLATDALTGQQHVIVPDSAPLRLSGAFTLAAWVYPTANTGTMPPDLVIAQKGIIEKWASGATTIDGYLLRLSSANTGNNTPLFSMGNGATQLDAQAASVIPLNTWTHVAGVYNGATMTLYVGGVSAATTPNSTALPTAANTAELHLGKDYGGNTMTGNIDEARIYSRALTAGEVGTLVTGVQAPPTGLAATSSPGQIMLTWTAAANATSYNVYRRLTGGGAFALFANTAATSYTDMTVTIGTSYDYQVTAVGALESAPAGPVTGTGQPVPPHVKGSTTHNLAHRCGCGSIETPGFAALALLALAALATLLRRR